MRTFGKNQNNDLVFTPESAVISIISCFYLIIVYHSLVIEHKAPKYVYGAGLSGLFFSIVYFNHNHSISEMNIAKFVAFSIVNFEFNE